MHTLSTYFVLGYHGCDAKVAKRLLDGDDFRPSENDYDWLGHGIYFWESNPRRALYFSEELKKRGKDIKTPTVVGAVIDLGFCLDLTTSIGVEQVKTAYGFYSQITRAAGTAMPENVGGDDLLLRKLDCAVLNALHQLRSTSGEPEFDSVKGVFVEGERIYEGAGLFEKTHAQICVRNPDAIKGVFRVPKRFL